MTTRRLRVNYVVVRRPSHPRASSSGDVYLHLLIAEEAVGHYLPVSVQVHHVDEDKRNNANSNLVICQDGSYHKLLHVRARVVRAGGDPNGQRICSTRRRLKEFAEFNRFRANKADGLQQRCRQCQSELYRGYKRPSDRQVA